MNFSCESIFGCLRMLGSILVIYSVFKIADWGGYDKLNMSLDQAFPLSVSITDFKWIKVTPIIWYNSNSTQRAYLASFLLGSRNPDLQTSCISLIPFRKNYEISLSRGLENNVNTFVNHLFFHG